MDKKINYSFINIKILIINLLIFLTFFLCWILIGDLNLLKLNWLVPNKGSLWSGKVLATNADFLWNHYSKIFIKESIYSASEILNKYDNKYLNIINTDNMILNLNLIYVLIGVSFFWLMLLPIFLFTKFISINICQFYLTNLICWIIFIFSGGMPVFNKTLVILIRILLLVVSIFVLFLVNNFIFNSILMNSKNQENVFAEYTEEFNANLKNTSEITKLIKNNEKDEDKFIEI